MIHSIPNPRLLITAEEFLDRHEISPPYKIMPLVGGRGHRQYRVRTGAGRFLLKQYFRRVSEPRDWLAAEFKFCQFLHRSGIRQAPEPIAWDEREGLALYEFIDGRPLRRGEIGDREIESVIDFVREINMHRRRPDARALTKAHEAAFSIAAHIGQIDRRVQRLNGIDPINSNQNEALRFARRELSIAWKRAEESVRKECSKLGIDPGARLANDRRILSPANFGLNNVLRTRNGTLRFLNLEGAGWDDPARLVGDFFFQPSLAGEARHLELFRSKVFSGLSHPEFEVRRSAIMLPLFKTHWCCRVLEDFLDDTQPQVGPVEPRSRDLPWLSPVAAARRILNSRSPEAHELRGGDRQ
ncbi:MAG: aminoglycoside phosphotransferase family protein [Myxococcales bacterium]|nr:aminoglycoside phosphotransferase family protein [Myxococcales bacterium]